MDGVKWRRQRKLASFQFSTKVLQEFSTVSFKSNAAKLAKKISLLAAAEETMDLQVKNYNLKVMNVLIISFVSFVFCSFYAGSVDEIDIRFDV